MKSVPYVIIGAGPTGLGAGYHFSKLGINDWLLLESSNVFGGLATSFKDDKGFIWDIGGHVQFSHYEYFDNAMIEFLGKDGWMHHQRESWVWLRDRFVPYPFQNNIRRLPSEDLNKCLQGLVELLRNPKNKPSNFGEWIDSIFGSGIAEIFMKPYNFKVWAFPPEMLNTVWVGERVSVIDLGRILSNIVFENDDLSWGPNNTFQFPKFGGTGGIWHSCGRNLPQNQIMLNSSVSEIDLDKRILTLNSGETIQYEKLISTIPILELIKISGQQNLMTIAKEGLLYSSSNIIGIGLKGKPKDELQSKCWMYFPEDNCPFYRVTVFSNYSPNNVPDINSHWSLMFEVSESSSKSVDHSNLINDVIQGAINTKLIDSKDDIISTWSFRTEYGYPTPGINRDESLSKIIPFFENKDVYSRGRFGFWKYEVSNQDHSFMQGVELVERLINGKEEITAVNANYANSKKHPWPFENWK